MDAERTHISQVPPSAETRPADAEPCVILRGGGQPEQVLFLDDGEAPQTVGRGAAAHTVIADGELSREHLQLWREGDAIFLRDLGSTNGTWLRGQRVSDAHVLRPGEMLHLGKHSLSLGFRNRDAIAQATEMSRDLEKASRYVLSLLPDRVSEGPVQLDWAFQPSAKLGGDVFGHHEINSRFLAGYLIDVSGHGVGAAMHSTSILAALRNQTLAGVDFTDPAQVLGALNTAFDMEQHDGYTFTIWYGVIDLKTRALAYASAGHHPAYLVGAQGGAPLPLRTRNPLMGAMPGITFQAAQITLPQDCRLHVFSDGCFEITDRQGRLWGLADFLPLLSDPPDIPAQTILDKVRAAAQPGPLADDFSIMSVRFR